MSENKLRKFIAMPRTSPVGDRKLQQIVLRDSKGNWLKRQIPDEIENHIIWQAKSGARVEESTRWLKSNIANKIIRHGDIWLYDWLGTTRKNKSSPEKIKVTLTSHTQTTIPTTKSPKNIKKKQR